MEPHLSPAPVKLALHGETQFLFYQATELLSQLYYNEYDYLNECMVILIPAS